MKIRSGFVSNSSSSSFILEREHCTPAQLKSIYRHIHKAAKLDPSYRGSRTEDDAWFISETPDYIMGSTIMDNFDMRWFLRLIGIPDTAVTFEDCEADWHPWDE